VAVYVINGHSGPKRRLAIQWQRKYAMAEKSEWLVYENHNVLETIQWQVIKWFLHRQWQANI
jgi:hypothetical protein